ncbi:MAG: hypothetical protein K9H64_07280 [Bacteroidales bacterium]|nr:hypothetical protein [Bacteroidales bacterium]MCF8455537.1 hypothetical protein [Bacteroidales bacterium]
MKIYLDATPSPGIANIMYAMGSLDGWVNVDPYSTFLSIETGLIDCHVRTGTLDGNPGFGTIYFYENNSVTPTRTKNIYIQ